MRTLLKITYAPAMLLGFNGAALAIVGSDLSRLWLAPLLLAAIATSFLVERLIPYDPVWSRDAGDTGRDVAHAVVNEVSAYLAAAMIPLLALIAPDTGLWPTEWPLWGQLMLAILVADFGITLCHYFSHRYEWLWRFHAVHHSVKRLYGFNGLMKHPVHQAIETLAGTAPLVLIGIPFEIGLALGLAVALQVLLQHSNTDMRIGPLRYLLALAPVHRFHHQKSAGLGDVNFGLFTNIWDHLLGTAAFDPAKRFASGDLGIAAEPDFPVSYLGQLAAPFRKMPKEVGFR